MLKLHNISLTHFKNYEASDITFEQNVVGICGLNGKGKTNLLDAVYYCCFTKSYFSPTDNLNIRFDKQGFRLQAMFSRQEQQQEVICINRGGNKKELYLNDVPYEKFSKHIGFLPVVMIAPDDIGLITAGSEGRRKYIDTVMSQVDASYLQHLITYNKVLQQRNSLLKNFSSHGDATTLLEILDAQLIVPAKVIFEKRKIFLQQLVPLVVRFYHDIAANAETVTLQYTSQLQEQDMQSLLLQSRQKDLVLQRSNAGIHKDDIGFQLNGQVFKNIASQGQRKSLLFALKLAEYEVLKSNKGFSPLLLLDDVFEKLDDSRMKNLLHWVCNENEGQVFITDTHRGRLEQAFGLLDVQGQIIEL
jgi:DNA replication and repair protein RecF